MALDKQELFDKLLQHLQLNNTSIANAFANAKVEKVIVHEISKTWEFNFQLEKFVEYDKLIQFITQLQQTFQEIATVDYNFTFIDDEKISLEQVQKYWQFILTRITKNGLNQVLQQQKPTVFDNTLNFNAPNEITRQHLVKNIVPQIMLEYQKLGFAPFKISVQVDRTIEDAMQQRLQTEQKEKERILVQQAQQKMQNEKKVNGSILSLGRKIAADSPITQMIDINQEERSIVVEGYIFDKEVRILRSERQLLTLKITDYSSSYIAKKFSRDDNDESFFENIQAGMWVKIRGSIQEDTFQHDLVLNIYDIQVTEHASRQDKADESNKRIEFHTHSNMSTMDATNSISDYVKTASQWGHTAIAITDTTGVQAFPEAYAASQKYNVKMIYGVEANLVNDGNEIGINEKHISLHDNDTEYVIFDVETTGLSAIYDKVIELSAVKVVKGNVVAEFEQFIDPGFHLSETTTKLTSITDSMVQGSKTEAEVFREFRQFYGDAILVGHNVTFDLGFMNTGYRRHNMAKIDNPVIDTLTLARFLYPDLRSYRLNTLAKKFGVVLEHHHRAIFDSETTGKLNDIFLKDAKDRFKIEFHDDLNKYMNEGEAWKHARPNHVTILAQNQTGLKNIFKLISEANINYFYRVPRTPRSVLEHYREGLLIGSADSTSDIFEAIMQKGYAEAKAKAKFYDYLEVQPKAAYQSLIDSELIANESKLEEIIQNIIQIGDELKIPVIATGDVHYLNPEDAIYRKVLVKSQGGANPLNRTNLPDLHFKTTDELLAEFSFLGAELAQKIVVDNPKKLATTIQEVKPLKEKLYTPNMEGAEAEIERRTYETARQLYGQTLPDVVTKRIEKELKSIIGNGFSVIYLISQRLVAKSNKDGYLVGSRGSVGSSVVATFIGITEVNPLPPHYRCPKCQYSEFFTKGEYESGYDLPDKICPNCEAPLVGDGQNIPFETFLGFKGNKVPDIDLNFSGDYQPIAHNYTKVMFGENNVFRAGTIGTVADKTAYGYVKAYEREAEIELRSAEEERLAKGATGVKRTTGQHPAGILVVPDYMDIYDFTPIQYPADDVTATWKTTHFDFHSIHDNILKIDILGHDDPTMIRTLQDLSGIDPQTIPTDDPGVMSLFSSPEVLGVTSDAIYSKTGTLGIPEFGTRFVRGMLEQTHPKNYSELLQISGLSHGTDVWLGNADELIKDGTATIANVIGTRDKIMTDLINYGMESESAFQIMEKVRKGKGISPEYQEEMHAVGVPQWYIDSCLKIKYMFPRAHAAAYVLMALRVAYFKVYFPMLYYSAYFSVRADNFDVVAMANGKDSVKAAINELNKQGDNTAKDKELMTVLELANEALERGIIFKMVDIEKSDATTWLIEDNTLLAPFNVLPGLGDNVAKQIIAARAEQAFISKEDLKRRGKVSNTLIEFMTQQHALDDLPDENQLSLFDF
ncbi:DNA polymerase-3 subunit alpha (Gram-positive type) [Weissella beninensis]|uniref:DNA polymerase III PolC-type n=1 Tax=Periweissella beninensis TaxID=504936 RepID=A0ABT0VFA3_9LACO|nr:DNA polymerase-3 subunit alpha (Gram-positive type) [Periweissella beninensis]MCM2436521.1 PolC-type DNA polymerase III [Periweissella beninensis]